MKEAARNELVAPYFRYVNLITVLRDSYGLKDLSPQHEALLEFIGQAWQDDKPLSVRNLMAVSTMASTATRSTSAQPSPASCNTHTTTDAAIRVLTAPLRPSSSSSTACWRRAKASEAEEGALAASSGLDT